VCGHVSVARCKKIRYCGIEGGKPDSQSGLAGGAVTIFTPEAYDAAEREAMKRLPNRVIEASRAVAFQVTGYPTRVCDVEELWRYAEGMHENRLRPTFDAIGGLTDREFELVAQITKIVANLTEKLCRHRVVPGASLMRAIPVYRAIKLHRPHGGSVFELGPGAGYVGALLVADNYKYCSSDVTQAFFLWQAHLLHSVRPEIADFQLPWWEWMMLASPPAVDVFTANHMLNEIHAHALIYTVRIAKEMLAKGGPRSIFLVENYGSDLLRKTEVTLSAFKAVGVSVIEVEPAIDQVKPTRGWSDLEALWVEYGGMPRTEDEKFMAALGIQ
jgi:hypothetical protein